MTSEPDLPLPAKFYADLARTLCQLLPAPPDDTPQAKADCGKAAIACFVALRPITPIEADLALQFVVLSAHATDCLRRENDPAIPIKLRPKFGAQGAPLMRQSRSVLNLLLREQKRRNKTRPIPKSEHRRRAESRIAAIAEQAVADRHRPDRKEPEQLSLEQRLSTVAACFLHQPGDPKVLS